MAQRVSTIQPDRGHADQYQQHAGQCDGATMAAGMGGKQQQRIVGAVQEAEAQQAVEEAVQPAGQAREACRSGTQPAVDRVQQQIGREEQRHTTQQQRVHAQAPARQLVHRHHQCDHQDHHQRDAQRQIRQPHAEAEHLAGTVVVALDDVLGWRRVAPQRLDEGRSPRQRIPVHAARIHRHQPDQRHPVTAHAQVQQEGQDQRQAGGHQVQVRHRCDRLVDRVQTRHQRVVDLIHQTRHLQQ